MRVDVRFPCGFRFRARAIPFLLFDIPVVCPSHGQACAAPCDTTVLIVTLNAAARPTTEVA